MLRKILTKLGLVKTPVWEVYDVLCSDKFKTTYVGYNSIFGRIGNNSYTSVSLIINWVNASEFKLDGLVYCRTLSTTEKLVLRSVISEHAKVYNQKIEDSTKLEAERFAEKLKEKINGTR